MADKSFNAGPGKRCQFFPGRRRGKEQMPDAGARKDSRPMVWPNFSKRLTVDFQMLAGDGQGMEAAHGFGPGGGGQLLREGRVGE